MAKAKFLMAVTLLSLAGAALCACDSECPESASTCPANCPPIHAMEHPGAGTCLSSAVVVSCQGRRDAKKSTEPGCIRLKDPKKLTVYRVASLTEEAWLTGEDSLFEACPDNVRARALAADTCDEWAIADASADPPEAGPDGSADAAGQGGSSAAGQGGSGGSGAAGGSGATGGAGAAGSAGASGAGAGDTGTPSDAG